MPDSGLQIVAARPGPAWQPASSNGRLSSAQFQICLLTDPNPGPSVQPISALFGGLPSRRGWRTGYPGLQVGLESHGPRLLPLGSSRDLRSFYAVHDGSRSPGVASSYGASPRLPVQLARVGSSPRWHRAQGEQAEAPAQNLIHCLGYGPSRSRDPAVAQWRPDLDKQVDCLLE